MSVIVTGMEIPESCDYCNMNTIRRGAVSVCHYCILAQKEIKSGEETLFDCPLKSVDGLIEKIDKKLNSGQWSEATVYGMKKAIAIIKEYCEMEDAE